MLTRCKNSLQLAFKNASKIFIDELKTFLSISNIIYHIGLKESKIKRKYISKHADAKKVNAVFL